MPNIRIKDIPTTASATSSTDFIGIDGSANGTRKLSAYSPTFGGNLTVSGTGANTFGTTGKTVIQQVGASGALTAGGWLYGLDEGLNLAPNGAGLNKKLVLAYFDGSSYRSALEFSNVSSGTATLKLSDYGGPTTIGGNLTVSGTGTSSFAGNVTVTGTGTNYTAIDTGSFVKFGNNQTSSNLQVGAQGFGGVIQGAQSGSAAYNILAQPYGGNFLIGTTTDGGQKLQVSGTANFSSGSSANTLSLISTDSTAYSATGYNSAYRLWLYGNGATSAYNFIRFSGGGSNEAAFGTVQNASGRAEFVWQTYDGSAYGERFRIASGGDATFAGTVTLPNDKAIYFKEVGGTAQRFALNSGDVIYIEPDQLHKISIGGSGVTNVGVGGIGVAGNSVFGGSIAIGNTVQTAASVASTHKVTISIGGSTYYLLATNV